MNERLGLAVEAARDTLRRAGWRWEVYARCGESCSVRWRRGEWERLSASRMGVACRLGGAGQRAFASVAGHPGTAGRDAARAALAALHGGRDPLPPSTLLGIAPVPLPLSRPSPSQVEAAASTLLAAILSTGAQVVELRLLAGWSEALLATGEGFVVGARTSAAVAEVRVGSSTVPPWLVHAAAPTPSEAWLRQVAADVAHCLRPVDAGYRHPPRLQDVLLAPPVAAALLGGLVKLLRLHPRGRRAISPAWRLVDARPGPDGLAPLPTDGEGLPARRIPLLYGGRSSPFPGTWEDANGDPRLAGGAVRPSYSDPPRAGVANLVVEASETPTETMLTRLGDGFHLLAPLASAARLELARARLVLPALGVVVERGQPAETAVGVTLRAGLGRLLAALEAVGSDTRSFSADFAVTTPSLLFRRLEVL